MRRTVGFSLALCLAAPLLVGADAAPRAKPVAAWPGCCGLAPWATAAPLTVQPHAGGGLFLQGYAYIVGGSPLRHHLGVTGQIPAAYAKLKNPLQPTLENAQAGAAVYEAECASCHGVSGLGDGPASKGVETPPAQLGWLLKIPPKLRDAFMYWSVADGGTKFGTVMPSYKDKLAEEKIWSVIGYIQARLPTSKPATKAPTPPGSSPP